MTGTEISAHSLYFDFFRSLKTFLSKKIPKYEAMNGKARIFD